MNYRNTMMRTASTLLMAAAVAPRYPDDAPAAPAPAAPAPAPVADPVGDPPAGDPPAAPAEGDPPAEPKAGDPAPAEPKEGDPPAAPAAPEKYELKLPEGLPEGQGFDTSAFEKAEPLFRELGLNGEQAQKVVDTYAKDILPVVVPQVQAQVLEDFGLVGFHQWADQVRVDPRFGGAAGKPISDERVAEIQTHVAKFRDQFGTPELTALLDTTTLGNHPEVVYAFYQAGKALAEDSFHRSDVGAQGKGDLATALYGEAFAPRKA